MFPKQLIIIYRISTVESDIDEGNNEKDDRGTDDEDRGNPACLKMIFPDI